MESHKQFRASSWMISVQNCKCREQTHKICTSNKQRKKKTWEEIQCMHRRLVDAHISNPLELFIRLVNATKIIKQLTASTQLSFILIENESQKKRLRCVCVYLNRSRAKNGIGEFHMHICACNTLLTDKLWTLVSFVSCIELLFGCLLFQIQMKKKKAKSKCKTKWYAAIDAVDATTVWVEVNVLATKKWGFSSVRHNLELFAHFYCKIAFIPASITIIFHLPIVCLSSRSRIKINQIEMVKNKNKTYTLMQWTAHSCSTVISKWAFAYQYRWYYLCCVIQQTSRIDPSP